jgi:hypothetical protein
MDGWRRKLQSELSFEEYAGRIQRSDDGDPPREGEFAIEPLGLVEETKIACMTGMLLCLGISRDNDRQKLSRARKDLFQFMNHPCGLVERSNPCRCFKKTRAFIAAGEGGSWRRGSTCFPTTLTRLSRIYGRAMTGSA